MVIDLGSGSLFKPQGLEQDSGRLSQRWGQDGASHLQFSVSLAADATVHTVTTGKRFYVDSIQVVATSAAVNLYLRDNQVGGTVRVQVYSPINATTITPLTTPIYFDTDCFLDVSAGVTGFITITGWEEDSP